MMSSPIFIHDRRFKMAKWHIKEISELSQISIRMLRHYDKIGLLKPSYRESNGYRCYTEPDLAKLQQIVALRYFGFSLSVIKDIVQKHPNVYAHLQAQQQAIKKQNEHLQQVSNVLEEILNRLSPSKSPDWHDLLLLIERYHMTNHLKEKLKNTWAGKILTEEEFESYLFLYEQFPEEFAIRESIIKEINQKSVGEPDGPDGVRIVCFQHDLAKKMKIFFSEQLKLNSSLIKRIQSGELTQLELTPEGTGWLARAALSYWLNRWNAIYDKIVQNINSNPEENIGKEIAKEWRGLIDESFSMGSRDFLEGLLLWRDIAKQDHEMKKLKKLPTLQESLKKCHIPLISNPEALVWINKALEAHSR